MISFSFEVNNVISCYNQLKVFSFVLSSYDMLLSKKIIHTFLVLYGVFNGYKEHLPSI